MNKSSTKNYLIRHSKKTRFNNILTMLIRSARLTPLEWRLYCVLDSYSGAKVLFPSYEMLAKKTNITDVKTIISTIQKLEEYGLLLVKREQKNRFKADTENIYILYDYKEWFESTPFFYQSLKMDETSDIIYVPSGYVNISNELLITSRLDATQLRCYCVLLSYSYKGTINPTYTQLAEDTNVSVRTIKDTIKELKELGLVEYNNASFTDEYKSNKYKVLNYFDWLKENE